MTSKLKSPEGIGRTKRPGRCPLAILLLILAFAGAADHVPACGPGPVPKPKIPPPPTSCQECPERCSASPCYVRSGAFKTTVEDLSIPTPGFPLTISRYYESARPHDGPLGRGWTLNLPVRLFYATYMFSAPSTYSKEADITMPNGDRFRFTENAGGTTYTPQPDRHDTLIKNGDGTFDLTIQKSRAKYRFSATGSMTSMTDERGNVLNLTYDGNGRLQTVADGAGSGRSFTVTWGPDGRISSVQDSGGRVVQYGYTNGNLTSVTDVAGRITTYSYQLTGSGWLLYGASDPWSRQTISVTYDAGTCHAGSISAGGESFDYNYTNGVPNRTIKTRADLNGSWWFYFTPEGWITDRVRSYSLGASGPTYHTDYYPDGSIQQTIDELGVKTFYTYNAQGHVVTVTRDHQGPNTIRYDYAYDPNYPDRVISITPVNPGTGVRNPDWQTWKYDYYQSGSPSPGSLFHVYRVRSTPLNPPYATDTLATYVYNAKGQVTQHTDAWNHTTDYTYDASFNLWKVTGPANNDGGTRPVTTYGYDGLGRVTSVTDPLNHATTYLYDNLNRVTSVTLPKPTTSSTLNFTTTFDYDDFDSPTGLVFTTVTDPNGKITKQGYDQFGRLARAIDAQNQVTLYGYTNGLLTSITDANGNLTTYEYDRLGRWLTYATRSNGGYDNYTYYIDGNVEFHTTPDGWRRNYYDRLKRVSRRDGYAPFFDFTYVGQKLTQVGEGDGYGWTQNNTMTYDASYRLQTVTEGTRGTLNYGYNPDDTLSSYAVTGGPTATYSYYPDRSLNTINWTPVAGQFKYRYTLPGQYQSLTYPNGGTRNYTYDDQGRLTQLTNLDPVAGNLATYGYGYDFNYTTGQSTMLGQRSSMTATVPSLSLNNHLFKYEYDPLYQLKKVTYPNVAPFSGEIDSWTYDAIGNRLTNTVNSTTQTYAYEQVSGHQGQRLLSDSVNTYTYPGPTGGTGTRFGPSGNFTFAWNNWGELGRIDSTSPFIYSYDYQGRRFQKSISGTITTYLYEGLNLIREVQGATTTDFLFGPGIDEPIALSRSGQAYYFGVDGLGSVTTVTNSGGVVQNRYLYDAWGNLRNIPTSFANPFGYTAREMGEAGLMYYRARYYQPTIGRFLSEDPLPVLSELGVSGHPFRDRYRYVENSPTLFFDPLGLEVYLCQGPSHIQHLSAVPHWWLKTSHSEAGQQGEYPFCPTQIRSEVGRSLEPGAKCKPIPWADEACVDRELAVGPDGRGKSTGRWIPGFNTCSDVANQILNQCRIPNCVTGPMHPQQHPLPHIPGLGNPDNH